MPCGGSAGGRLPHGVVRPVRPQVLLARCDRPGGQLGHRQAGIDGVDPAGRWRQSGQREREQAPPWIAGQVGRAGSSSSRVTSSIDQQVLGGEMFVERVRPDLVTVGTQPLEEVVDHGLACRRRPVYPLVAIKSVPQAHCPAPPGAAGDQRGAGSAGAGTAWSRASPGGTPPGGGHRGTTRRMSRPRAPIAKAASVQAANAIPFRSKIASELCCHTARPRNGRVPRVRHAERPGGGRDRDREQGQLGRRPAGPPKPWVQMNRNVPVSSSRASTGAPGPTPISTGTSWSRTDVICAPPQ